MAREKMPDVIVLLPGITGSRLRRGGEIVWGFSGRVLAGAVLTGGASIRRALALPADPPDEELGDGIVADALIDDLHLLPGLWKIDGYGRIAEAIQTLFEVKEHENFFRFPYDWRRDNRVAARRLQRESARWLADWRERSGNRDAKLILVGHSMGGLVARYFLEVLEGWKETRALVTFGTPHRGSLNAVDTLVNGMRKGPFGLLDLSSLARQFTALYQLLPIYPCIDDGGEALRRVAEATLPNVDPAKARDALAFHREIEASVAAHLDDETYRRGRYGLHPIVGINQRTAQSARLAGDRVEVLETLSGRDQSGDGTVPRISATPIELSDTRVEVFAATKHGSLQNADAVIAHLQGLLASLQLDLGQYRSALDRQRRTVATRAKVALEVEDLYWGGEDVLVRARPDAPGVFLQASVQDAETGKTVAVAPMQRAPDGSLVLAVGPLPAGAYRVTVRGDAGVEPAHDAFAVAELREGEEDERVGALGGFRKANGGGAGRQGAAPVPAPGPSPEMVGAAPPPPLERAAPPPVAASIGLAPTGAAPGPGLEPPPTVAAVVSAEAPAAVQVGATALVDVRAELAEGARPLAHAAAAAIRPGERLRAILSIDGPALVAEGPRTLELDAPAPGRAAQSAFTVRAIEPGRARLSVLFRQGGSELAAIPLELEVTEHAPGPGQARGTSATADRDAEDDDALVLLVDEEEEGGRVHFRYRLFSDPLGFHYDEFLSKEVIGGGATTLAYVKSLYRRLTEDVLRTRADAAAFADKIAGLGLEMCGELFPADFVDAIWPVRHRIKVVQVTSWEPFIPWELVRLRHPSGKRDERHLAEYGLVRTLHGRTPPRRLRRRDWSYLAASYPGGTYESVGAEVVFMTDDLPKKRGIVPRAIPATYEAFRGALAAGDFDVLHVACHGLSPDDDLSRAVLVLGDEVGPGGPRPVQVDATTLEGFAQLAERRPLVFLNACESGKLGPSLTAWGGWPASFLRAGAGAFVGTSWAVREKPARLFAETFYGALLDGVPLAEAALRARNAARLGDGSWLAFKVYGHPLARLEP